MIITVEPRYESFFGPGGQFDDVFVPNEICDYVSLMFKGDVSRLTIRGAQKKEQSLTTRGECRTTSADGNQATAVHVITLYRLSIYNSFKLKIPCGGNRAVAPDFKTAVLMTLAHEIRHAEQSLTHLKNRPYWDGRYRSRACEVDARSFVDSNIETIMRFAGHDVMAKPVIQVEDELLRIVDVFSHVFEKSGGVSRSDLVFELRNSGINNVVNVKRAIGMLAEHGVDVV